MNKTLDPQKILVDGGGQRRIFIDEYAVIRNPGKYQYRGILAFSPAGLKRATINKFGEELGNLVGEAALLLNNTASNPRPQ